MAKETDQYNMICESRFDKIDETLEKLMDSVKGNGKEGVIPRLGKVELIVKALVWIVVIVTIPAVGMLVKSIFEHL